MSVTAGLEGLEIFAALEADMREATEAIVHAAGHQAVMAEDATETASEEPTVEAFRPQIDRRDVAGGYMSTLMSGLRPDGSAPRLRSPYEQFI